MIAGYIPILIMIVLAVLLAAVLLLVSHALGPKRYEKRKLTPYECGIPPVGDTRGRFSARYYLIAALFILFDVEIAFLFAWAVIFKELGLLAFIEVLVFLIIILGGYFYLLNKEALEWD